MARIPLDLDQVRLLFFPIKCAATHTHLPSVFHNSLILVSLEARHVLALSRNGGPTTDGTQGDLAGHHAHVDPRTSTSLNSSTSIGGEKAGVVHNEKLSTEGPGVIGERDVEKGHVVHNADLPVALNTEAETGRIA